MTPAPGPGKTTLCRFVAEEARNCLYLAFNRNMRENARRHLPRDVEARTTDSLAYKVTRPAQRWGEERTSPNARNDYRQIADELDLPRDFRGFTRSALARLTRQIVSNYCNSADERISVDHVPTTDFPTAVQEQLAFWAEDLWYRMLGASGAIPVRPDQVMKVWQLEGGTIPDAFEYVIFDEAQDANGSFMEILRRSKTRRILIGDHHQQLYQWRGAIDAMAMIDGEEHHITQSWRFGEEIATYANMVLALKSRPPSRGVVGCHDRRSKVQLYSAQSLPEWPITILARTNAQVFDRAVQIAQRGHQLHVVGGVDELQWLLLDAVRIFRGIPRKYQHPALVQISSWMELVSLEEATGDAELRRVRRLVETYDDRLEDMLNRLNQHHVAEEQAGVILSTTHKIKGREWRRVMLLDDFIDGAALAELDPEARDSELNVLYVAATRATHELYISESLSFGGVARDRRDAGVVV